MSYVAKVFNVMIASPSDVANERNIVRDVIYEWNAVHSNLRKIVLLPIAWETHSSPEIGSPPQDIINKQILDKCDLLIGVFWTRIGTSTRDYASGTVEEIEKHVKYDKPAMLYFSNQPVHPDSVDADQYKKLKEFKEAYKERGLLETYDSLTDFKDKFYRQLQLKINEHPYFRVSDVESSGQTILSSEFSLMPPLSRNAQTLLKEASLDSQGTILHLQSMGGTTIQTNGKNLITVNEHREVAKWEAALNELLNASLIKDRGYKGEVFELTDEGYKWADVIQLTPDSQSQ
jgi:hypothetical protein